MDEIIHYLTVFISRLWQIHVFGEGNTRSTVVFFIKYLRMLGFDVTNDIHAENAWYFRNSLVRANYNDVEDRGTVLLSETKESSLCLPRPILTSLLSDTITLLSGKQEGQTPLFVS